MNSDSYTLFIVEDDETLGTNLTKGLVEAGYTCFLAMTGAEAMGLLQSDVPDLILLDLTLPDTDGLSLLDLIRRDRPDVPVIITSARSAIPDRVNALEVGADDYLIKPFAFEELLARVRVQLRHAERSIQYHQIGDLQIDKKTRTARRGDRALALTKKEFDLLDYLASLHGKTASRDMLCEHVWKIQASMSAMDNVIDVQISRLRNKLTQDGEEQLLHTVRGVGFVLKGTS